MDKASIETNEWARAIVESAHHLIVATDPTGVVTWFNKASEDNLGYTAGEVVGKESPALWHDFDEVQKRAVELSEELQRPVEPGFDVFVIKPRLVGAEKREWTFVRKDRSRFPASLTVTCVRAGASEIVGYLGIIEDIREQKRIQRELAEARAFLDLMNANSPDYVFVKDEEFRIVEANPAFLSLYPEDKRDRVIGTTTVEEYPEEEAEAFLAKDREAFDQGASQTLERITFPDGTVRVLDTRKVRFENSKGQPFIVGIARDITERERLIADLRQSNEELEEFAYRTSHDLRSPLISSIALLARAQQAVREHKNELALRRLNHVETSLTKLESLVTDILSLTQAQREGEEAQDVDLAQLVDSAFDNLTHLDGFERLDIRKELNHSGPIVLQPKRLQLIVENLVSNAVKYQNPQEQKPFVRIATHTRGTWLEISVTDNGLGIPKEQQPKLFQMFKRFHSRVSFGSGLGLYMVKKSAAMLGGDAHFEDPGVGALFRVRVPCTPSLSR